MFTYWFIFFFPAFFSFMGRYYYSQKITINLLDIKISAWKMIYFILIIIIGLRFEVGGDWPTYIDLFESYKNSTVNELYGKQDLLFTYLNEIAVITNTGVYFINLACSFLFVYGLFKFCEDQPLCWLSLTISIPYLVIVVAMGYTRQGAAIGISMLAISYLLKGKNLLFYFLICLASSMHKSAVILVPLCLFINTDKIIYKLLVTSIGAFLLYVLLLQESVDFLIYGYIETEYQSAGAKYRVGMNALAGFIFLMFRRKFILDNVNRNFWTWMSVFSLIFIPILNISPSSTAVDRVALYFIPLQLFVLSRLPLAFKNNINISHSIMAVVLYSFLLQYVWLYHADTSFAWIPYKSILFNY